jgi:hypothetical protein
MPKRKLLISHTTTLILKHASIETCGPDAGEAHALKACPFRVSAIPSSEVYPRSEKSVGILAC